ncbi:hypothetical protein HORIV_49050 [Vreelandella olivaria]|uniref:Uncharacterized protein n=1 Tax=Vreelandella olivaria TaxID=390919 RepID=A0ABM7GP60_9GAMM|nr:hypothetical protein HORIV_49050 [Halomonas olivaria]
MNNSQGNMIVELIRAYYFTKRERPNIEQANLTNDLVAIVESARYQSVQLQFNITVQPWSYSPLLLFVLD